MQVNFKYRIFLYVLVFILMVIFASFIPHPIFYPIINARNLIFGVGEGQSGNTFKYQGCVFGLVAISNNFPTNGDTCMGAPNGQFYCTKCGNGICGKEENSCNCPKDCK